MGKTCSMHGEMINEMLAWKPERTRQNRRSRLGWKDNIKMHL
jgi:hypothetical protein